MLLSTDAIEAIDRPPVYPPAGTDSGDFISHRSMEPPKKYSLANFYKRISLYERATIVPHWKEPVMSWKTPKIVEVPVGMEINMYACAARK